VLSIRVRSTRVLTKKPISFRSPPVAVGDGGANADVVLTTVTRQQDIEGSDQRHEERGLGLVVQLRSPVVICSEDFEGVCGSLMVFDERARMMRWAGSTTWGYR